MGKKNKTKKEGFMLGVLVLMVSQVLIKLLGLVYNLYVTNRPGFGDEGNAIRVSGYQIYALLLTLSSIGVPNAISKLISERVAIGDEKGANRVFKIALVTFATLGLIGTLILMLGARFIAQVILQIPEAELTLVALSPSVFFVSIASVFRGYFNGRTKISTTAKSQTLEQIFKTVFTILVVEVVAIFTNVNVTLMAAGANLATTLSVFLSFAYIFIMYKMYKKELKSTIVMDKDKKFKEETVKSILKKILYVSIPISLSAIMSSLTKNIDSITVVRGLKHFLDATAAKEQYGILGGKVDTLVTLPLSFNIAFGTALVPAIAASKAKKDMETIKKRVSFSLLVTMLLGLPCTFGMFIFAQPILNLLFPNASNGALILQVSSFTIIFTVLTQTINGALQGFGKVMVPAIAASVGLIAKIILNIILVPIPAIGAAGAAFASCVYCLISCVIGYVVLRKNIDLNLDVKKGILKPILATIIMCIGSYLVYMLINPHLPGKLATILAILVAMLIYVIAVIGLKIFTKEELYMLPYGEKIYKLLQSIGVYKKENLV